VKRFQAKQVGGYVPDDGDDLGILDEPMIDPSAVRDATRGAFSAVPDAPFIALEPDLANPEPFHATPRPAFSSAGSFGAPLRAPQMPAASVSPSIAGPPTANPGPRSPFALTPTADEEQIFQEDRSHQEDPWSAANAPIGQGARPADDDPIVATVPTANGGTRPEAAPPLAPQDDRTRKLNSSDAFGPNAGEQKSLAAAREGDDRQDRGGRIARGVFAGLGLLGAATGMNGLAGIGTAGLGVTNAAMPEAGRRTSRAEADIAQRLQRVNAERTQNDRNIGAQREAESARVAGERQARLDEANLGLTTARTEAIGAESSRAEAEQAMAQRGAAGFRDYIRARVAAIPAGQTRAPLDAVVNAETFNGIEDPEALYRILGSVDAVDRRRGGQGVGGSGGTTRGHEGLDANGNVIRLPGHRRPAPGHPAPSPGGTPIATPAGTPVDETGEVIDITDPASVTPWIQRVLNSAGISGRDAIQGYVSRWVTAPTDGARSDVLKEVSQLAIQAERDNAGGRPAGVPEADWTRMTRQLTPFADQRRRAVRLEGVVQHAASSRPLALRAAAALAGNRDTSDFDAQTLTDAHDLVRELAVYANPLLQQRSGAAVSDGEFARFLRELSAGRWDMPVAQVVAAIQRQVDGWEEQILEYGGDYDERAFNAWTDRHMGDQ
jgi:hypothetical protein